MKRIGIVFFYYRAKMINSPYIFDLHVGVNYFETTLKQGTTKQG